MDQNSLGLELIEERKREREMDQNSLGLELIEERKTVRHKQIRDVEWKN